MKDRPDKDQRTIVFVTFETEFARSGGLGAVMGLLPRQVARHEKECFLIAPHFKKITDLERLQTGNRIKEYSALPPFQISTQNKTHTVEISEVIGLDGFKSYLLSAEGFFTAPIDPYVNPYDPAKPIHPYTNPNNPDRLVGDALFLCAAVPKALLSLGKSEDVVFQLQDWETACVARAVQNEEALDSAACVLTLHNPYDRYLDRWTSSRVTSECMAYLGLSYDNVLPQMIPLMDGPLTTVSQNFADELTTSPLHHDVFADHLQNLLESKGVVGIDNGLFGERKFPFSETAYAQAKKGDYAGIQEEKWARRIELGRVIEAYQEELAQRSVETWGDDLELSDPLVPVFFLLGRDDPRQKGFDVAAAAIQMIPQGKARYIFTPVPGDEGLLGLDFLKKLAKARPGEVKVFPFRLTSDAFTALQLGSSFLVMCSLYEPFGAATDAYLTGMPVIARATGGLVQQVAPYPSAALSRHGRQLVTLFHDRSSRPTGFLFREPSAVNDKWGWKKIVDCNYWNKNPKDDRIEDRRGTPLFDAMAQRAAWAMQDAIDLYTSSQAEYTEMIYQGYRMLDRFSWDRSVREYQRLYDRVCG